ncbi:dual specificity mitogen-activated protein kinase [Blastocystis sp. subtype 4]|uniref:dual specificity mitogen-activated protein kinase n=1 Tax=Blastocystis sp. subtype 4 TaxID=944170 RepID=UPI0007114BB8|nr:dual specificity mitogen-activated protein kinase [Blastocystis sp. subtype 4]KNB43118.1 dual specificity mitogen-activated protein kinase [Blastocystis sp. subtype 4]|eukprot:XP_014526561.1 dual specificity mitogen-activated protein kinase [Blastocystis sp. subtype 4]
MAVKVVPLASNSDSQVFMCRELNTLRFSECPYLIDFYGATVYGDSLLLILMEYMDLVRKKLGGMIPESLLGKVAYCVFTKDEIDNRS